MANHKQLMELIKKLAASKTALMHEALHLRAGLEAIKKEAGNLGDGAPDAGPLAHEMLSIESMAKDALAWPPKAITSSD